jgi:hypothetical protein
MEYSVKNVVVALSVIVALGIGSTTLSAHAAQPNNPGNSGNSGNSGGGQTPTVIDCSVDDVKITTVQLLTDGAPIDVALPGLPISASSCLAVEGVNNSFFNGSFLSDFNLGYDEDGWLNKGELNDWWTGPGAFIDEADLLDLDGDNEVDDPGWIYIGKDEGAGFEGETSHNDTSSYTFEDDLITFDNCSSSECVGGESRSGEWTYLPPKNNPPELLNLLGGSFFDQVAVIFKAGNGFAMYNFTIEDLGIDPVLAGDFNFAFGGTWDIDNTLGSALSNMTFWARDPIGPTVEVPEPSTIALFLLSGIFLYRRKKNE